MPVEKIDVMDDRGEALANQYGVRGVPTAILVSDDGRRLRTWPKLPTAEEVLEEVRARQGSR